MTSQERSQISKEIVKTLNMAFPDDALITVVAVPLDDIFITLSPMNVHPLVRILSEQFSFKHLSTITGDDTGEGVCVLYHFWNGFGISLRIVLPYDHLHLSTLTDLIPGAAFYEREVAEMLGVTFINHPNPTPLFLPDDWHEGFPLRREES